MPNVLSPRDLVSRPDNMDETLLHILTPLIYFIPTGFKEMGICRRQDTLPGGSRRIRKTHLTDIPGTWNIQGKTGYICL